MLGYAYISGALFRTPKYRLAALAALSAGAILVLGRTNVAQNLFHPFDTQTAQMTMVCVGWLITLAIAATLRAERKWRIPQFITELNTLYVVHYPLLLLAYSCCTRSLMGLAGPPLLAQ